MNTAKKISLWLMTAAFAVCFFHTKSYATASSGTVNVQVSINASKSIAVNVSTYSFGALAINISSVSSPVIVTNDSGAIEESYAIQGSNARPTGAGATWNLVNSTGAIDAYALQVQFSSATPADVDSAWANPATNLTTSVQNCTTDSTFGNGTAGESCINVFPMTTYRDRNMFIRMHTPLSVSDTNQKQASVVLTIQ